MGFSDNKTAKFPGALGDLLPVMDKLASSVFETSAKMINTGDETYIVPTSSPYAIRLRYVPKETRDGSGNPIGVAILSMTEIAWSDTAAPSTAQFMVNYLNGEVKFSAASAGASVQPAYQGVESRVWAEMLNEALRELKKTQEIVGINIQGAYQTAKDRIIATEGEVQTARAGRATLDERLDEIDAALAPMAGASPTRQEPSAETGVLGTAQIELDFDLYADTDTVIAANVKLKDSQNVDYPLTLSYNKTNRRITGTHSALVDEVYTVYTLAGLRDALGRSVTPVSWSYGVGAAVANDTPDVTNFAVLNPSLLGFTAKGTITDLENDTITRVDVRYGTVNNPEAPGNLTVQLTGSDIAAFQSVNGKTLNLSLAAGNWYSWARAAALLPSGGTQVGDWSTSFGFVVASNARPVVSALQTLAQSQTGFTAKGTITDNETDPITQLDIVWSQNGSADPDTLFNGLDKVSYTAGGDIDAFESANGKAIADTLATGDWFWWARGHDAGGAGSWVRIGSAFNIPAHAGPTVAPTLILIPGNTQITAIVTNAAAVAASCSDGATISGYNYQHSTNGTDWTSVSGTQAARYDIPSLTNGTPYQIRARAVDNQGGLSGYGAASGPATPAIPYCLSFDGVDDYITLATLGNFGSSLANGIIWERKFKSTTDPQNYKCLFSGYKDNNTATAFDVSFWRSGGAGTTADRIYVLFRGDTGTKLEGYTTDTCGLFDGLEHQIQVKVKPSTQTVEVYIDGVLRPFTFIAQQTPATFTNLVAIACIGAYNRVTPVNPSSFVAAKMRDQKIYLNYDSPTLYAHWKMDENTGTTATDSAGSNNGTIVGATWSTM